MIDEREYSVYCCRESVCYSLQGLQTLIVQGLGGSYFFDMVVQARSIIRLLLFHRHPSPLSVSNRSTYSLASGGTYSDSPPPSPVGYRIASDAGLIHELKASSSPLPRAPLPRS